MSSVSSVPLNQNNPLSVIHKVICKHSLSSLLHCKWLQRRDHVSCISVSSETGKNHAGTETDNILSCWVKETDNILTSPKVSPVSADTSSKIFSSLAFPPAHKLHTPASKKMVSTRHILGWLLSSTYPELLGRVYLQAEFECHERRKGKTNPPFRKKTTTPIEEVQKKKDLLLFLVSNKFHFCGWVSSNLQWTNPANQVQTSQPWGWEAGPTPGLQRSRRLGHCEGFVCSSLAFPGKRRPQLSA